MYLDAGVGAIVVAAILYAWAHRMHHRVDAPHWAKTQKFVTLTGVVVAVLVPLGTGWVAVGGHAFLDALGLAGWLALLAAPIALLIVGPWLAGWLPAPRPAAFPDADSKIVRFVPGAGTGESGLYTAVGPLP